MVFVDAPGQAHNGAPGVLIPVGRAQTREGGHHIAAVGIRHLSGHILGILGGIDEFHLIPQPLDGGTRHEDGALQGVLHLAVQAPGDGGDQTVFAEHGGFAGIHQQEAAGAVGVLGLAGTEAGLSEEGGLLIPGGAGDGNGRAEKLGQSFAVDAAAGPDLRQHAFWDVQLRQNLIVPLQGVDVKEHGPGGVGVVGHMGLAAGELPDQPGFHGAEEQLAPPGPLPDAGDVLQNPAQLGSGKVGVDDQAGFAAVGLRQALGLEAVAVLAGAAALPDDGPGNRLAGELVPDDGGFPLIGDADGGDVGGRGADVGHGQPGHLQLGGPDLVGVMLHPAGLGEILGEFLLGHGAHLAPLIKQNTAVGRGTCVQRHNVSFHCDSSPNSDSTLLYHKAASFPIPGGEISESHRSRPGVLGILPEHSAGLAPPAVLAYNENQRGDTHERTGNHPAPAD